MSDRRPHWDDDLIDAVRDAVDVEFDGIWQLSEDSIRAVIAAVEDWQAAQPMDGDWGTVRWSVAMYQHYARSSAAIQRVRGWTPYIRTDGSELTAYERGFNDAVTGIVRALDDAS
jgi:hypothetical protein